MSSNLKIVILKRIKFDAPEKGYIRLGGPNVAGTYPCIIGIMDHIDAINYFLEEWKNNKDDDYYAWDSTLPPTCIHLWHSAWLLAVYYSEGLDKVENAELDEKLNKAEIKIEESYKTIDKIASERHRKRDVDTPLYEFGN
jgi:hypothetical protein